MKIAAIIQARGSSTRLPEKVLKKLPYGGDLTVLDHVILRLKRCHSLNEIIIATTTDCQDNDIVAVAQKQQIKYFRGSKENVLSRYYLAAKENNVDVIVRITSDCPCIDPEIVDAVIDKHINDKADYTSNVLTRAYPHGMDTEVISFKALEKAYTNAENIFESEHVTPYIYKSHPEMFRISSLEAPKVLCAPEIRITLDTEADYILLCAVFDYLYSKNEFFSTKDIIELFNDKPWLRAINKNVLHKRIFDTLAQELEEAVKLLDIQDFKRASGLLQRHLQ